mgnify:CR=1 FL=1
MATLKRNKPIIHTKVLHVPTRYGVCITFLTYQTTSGKILYKNLSGSKKHKVLYYGKDKKSLHDLTSDKLVMRLNELN